MTEAINQGSNAAGAVAGSFTLSAQMPNGKSLTFSGYVLQGEAVADVNAKLDLAASVVERQRLAAEIPVLEKALEQQIKAKAQFEGIVEELGGKERLSTTEREKQNAMRINLKAIDDEIRRGEIAIADARRALLPAD